MVPFTFVFALNILIIVVLLCAYAVLSFVSVLHHDSAAAIFFWNVLDYGGLHFHFVYSEASTLLIRQLVIVILHYRCGFDYHFVGDRNSWKRPFLDMLFVLLFSEDDANFTAFKLFISVSVCLFNFIHFRRQYVNGVYCFSARSHHLANVFAEEVLDVLLTLNLHAITPGPLNFRNQLCLVLFWK